MLAIEAGTLMRTTGSPLSSQLQDLSEWARVAVELDRRFYVLERRVRVLEARSGEDHDRGGVHFDLALADQPVEERERGGRSRLGKEALAARQLDLGGQDFGIADGCDHSAGIIARGGGSLPRGR